MTRVMLNCWLVAMWLWLLGHCRQYAWIRRSHAFRGLIPHFGFAEQCGWRYLRVIEYIPPKRVLWSRRNLLFAFDGCYRVWHFRLQAVRKHPTKAMALNDFWKANGTSN